MCIFFIILLMLNKLEFENSERLIHSHSYKSFDHNYYEIEDYFDMEDDVTTKENFPFLVSIELMTIHKCGGTLISATFVLTAAHCLIKFDKKKKIHKLDATNYRVIIGVKNLNRNDLDEKYVNAKKTYIHPNFYRAGLIYHDIGLLELVSPNTENVFIKLANGKQIANSLKSREHTLCTIAGWGKSENNANIHYTPYLQSASIFLISSRICENSYPPHYFLPYLQLCTYKSGVDSCQGDSGGPLICNGVQYGIISFGIGCAQNYPSIHSRVDANQEWITRISGVSIANFIEINIIHFVICLLSIFLLK